MNTRGCAEFSVAVALFLSILLAPVASFAVTIDNGDPGTSSLGAWDISSGTNPYGEDSLFSRDGAGAFYSFEAAVAGPNEVYLWWTYHSGRCSSVRVEISDSSGLLDTVFVNQLEDGGQWNFVGSYDFDGVARVKLFSDTTDCTSCADAVSFIDTTTNLSTIKIMPLGDSITLGSASGIPEESLQVSYRKALWDRIKGEGYKADFLGSLVAGQDVANFDPDHEGHPALSDGQVADDVYLWLWDAHPVQVVLLHIGTNDLDTSPDDVERILDEIDLYESTSGQKVWVILARIINRMDYVCFQSSTTTTFNDNVEAMAQARISDPFNPDRIVIVDMECGAGLDYREQPLGDMNNLLHPYALGEGYQKMARIWFEDGLREILPVANAGTQQNVDEGDYVLLDGSGSIDPKSGSLLFQWEQTAGTSASLSDADTEQPSFFAPDVASDGETLTFQLTVTDEDGFEHTDTVNVVVNNPTSPSKGGGGGGGGGGCFIATAVYGSRTEAHVQLFREFRDRFLVNNPVGRAFVDFYYTYSPPLAQFIAKHDTLRNVARWALSPLVAFSWLTLITILMHLGITVILRGR